MKVKCINSKPLGTNTVAPNLVEEQEYEVKEIIVDSQGFEHYDIGLISHYNYISSFDIKETVEELPRSSNGKIHWCHPSRFIKI